ncbi:bifunctional diaminohydroxyphosphoribosylaminopyrimidine deaminase/5-amino-6-(5-phosphoribosylamino)uracil reductase RibD [Pontibacillus litoralis]|uniref:Riboflavin biosynthesis protein RibD n=1 Tax=Pontibacillus litoralis JSM 072002 TaxID=1385512 RepID=A0A0A5HU52_9BACI|nr:bifunctional diaminohydroxyphosphoribosylaminopyrimidine deaminase/5-amino-6-(5-phosphoribosylamino)uracil reductase RibD [Pontibacillus litoralis]KGX87177.1 5-amino-6-(5-phosphoribosylamino)uracil reductase [Pontibacillus litoralis JSM 072002]
MDQDAMYMQLALQMAKATAGQTSPNPCVGAVVVKGGQVLGMGAHLQAGDAHAEVHALQMAGSESRDATIYVTLEPCSHYGKTPPCADAIVKAGVKRAVISALDPNPQVSGLGVERLRDAGIEVEIGIGMQQADQLNEMFYHWVVTKTPYVTMKAAMSLDGKIATSTGESKWITSPEAREDAHHYRHTHDGIVVGVNTVIQDQPSLTTRLPNGGRNPVRIVLDTHLRTPIETPLIQHPDAPTWIITGSHVEQNKINLFHTYDHVQIIPLRASTITINKVLSLLGEKGITSLFVEGGAQINDAFLQAGCVNQVIQYIAPKLIGGKKAKTPIEGKGFQHLCDAFHLQIAELSQIGSDIKIVAKRGGKLDVHRHC